MLNLNATKPWAVTETKPHNKQLVAIWKHINLGIVRNLICKHYSGFCWSENSMHMLQQKVPLMTHLCIFLKLNTAGLLTYLVIQIWWPYQLSNKRFFFFKRVLYLISRILVLTAVTLQLWSTEGDLHLLCQFSWLITANSCTYGTHLVYLFPWSTHFEGIIQCLQEHPEKKREIYLHTLSNTLSYSTESHTGDIWQNWNVLQTCNQMYYRM